MSLRITVHHEPTTPDLWVVYVGGQRVAQFERREDAQEHAARLRRSGLEAVA